MEQAEQIHPAVVRRQTRDRGPVLLATRKQLRDLSCPFVTLEAVVEIFREAQRMPR